MRTAHFRGALTEKRGFRWRNITTLPCKYCEEISRKDEKVTSRHIMGAAARCPPRPRCAVPCMAGRADISRALSVSAQVRHIAVTYDRGAASRCFEGTFHFCAVGISHMFVYDDNYAGQTSIRVRRRAMDLRADLDKGAAGNTCRLITICFFQ